VSFSFDPFSSNPVEPRWQEFSLAYNKLAIRDLGGNASPIQTQWLIPATSEFQNNWPGRDLQRNITNNCSAKITVANKLARLT